MLQEKLIVLVNWIDRGEEWVRPRELRSLPSLEEMCTSTQVVYLSMTWNII